MLTSILLILGSGVAQAAPTTLTHSGRLLDAAGTPLSGSVDLETSLYASASGGAALWTEPDTGVPLAEGYFTVLLGDDEPLTDALLEADALYVQMSVDGVPLGGRMPLSSVPYARHSDSVIGGVADVSEVRIDGVVVVDSGRNASVASLTVAGVAPVAIDPSSCDDGAVAQYASGTWTCRSLLQHGVLYIAPTVFAAQTTTAGSGTGGSTGSTTLNTSSVTVVNSSTSLTTNNGGSGTSGARTASTNSVALTTASGGAHGHTMNTRRGVLQLEGYCNVASPTANNNCNTTPQRFVEIRGDSDYTTYLRILNDGGHTHSVGGHSHTVTSHTHSLPNHAHSIAAHTHTASPHAHSIPAHTHAGFAHDHTLTVSQPSQGWVSFPAPLATVDGPENIVLGSVTTLTGDTAAPPDNLRVLLATPAGFSWAADSSTDGFLVSWQAVTGG